MRLPARTPAPYIADGTGDSPVSICPCRPIAPALAMIGHQHDRRIVEIAPLLQPAHELADQPICDLNLPLVLWVVAAVAVAGLIGTQELQDEEIWIIRDQ